MSDPYEGTVTVRNILNHIISPKIVSDGNGGYTTRVDLVNIDRLVNVDRLILNTIETGTGGVASRPYTGQYGVLPPTGSINVGATHTVFHRDVTPSSLIITSLLVTSRAVGSFQVTNNTTAVIPNQSVVWFIVKF